MTARVERTAPAKLNLFLHVVGRRADGYHELDSLVAFLDLGDRLRLSAAVASSLAVAGPMAAGVPTDAGNLVLRAVAALAEAYGLPPGVAIALEKRLPSAAGLGGGSADAAATLSGLVELWGLPKEPARLAAIGLRLGADVPVCLAGTATRMQGIGEQLSPLGPLPACGIVLANPGVGLATAAVFKARRGDFSSTVTMPGAFPTAAALADFLGGCRNDLEAAAIGLAPVVADALAWLRSLPGARIVRMAGSGTTCFALFDDRAAATAALVGRPVPAGWWVQSTAISDRP